MRVRRNAIAGLLGSCSSMAMPGYVGLCSIEGEGEGGGGGGGAAAMLDDDEGGGTPSPTPAQTPTPTPTPAASGMEWAAGISAEKAEGEELSNLEWLQKRGHKNFEEVVSTARGMEKSLRDSGKVKVPGDDAKPEEIAAFREAIGVPEKAEGYEVKLPEVQTNAGDFKLELDTGMIDALRPIAHEHNVSGAAFTAMVDAVIQKQLETIQGEGKRADDEMAAKVKEWGADADARKAEFKRGAEILGIGKEQVAKLQKGGNTGLVLDLVAKVGALAGEDFFAEGGGSQKFGVSSEAEAQAELDRMTGDPAIAAKIKAKDPTARAKYDRLTEAVAHFREQAARKSG